MSAVEDQGRRVASLFDELAEDYDGSGVAFFGPIAEGLVEVLRPSPGEDVVDVGCGRGAVTLPAARAVGEQGTVLAVDISPSMVEVTGRLAAEAGLPQVRTAVVGVDELGLEEGSADVVAASLVLFFAPDPVATASSWVRLLRPGGRIGVATFGDPDPTWQQVDALFGPYLPPQLRDARTTGANGPFTSDEGVEAVLRTAGAAEPYSVRRTFPVRFRDADHWRAFSMSTGQRAFWGFVPEERREPLFREAADLLEGARSADGDLVLSQDVRYTLGVRPDSA
jgi:ubiquinone/menaquinone biosynthesis C-methylase UbiE